MRNERGEELLALLGDEVRTTAPGSAGKRQGSVKGFLANVQCAAGGLPLRRMPEWLRPVVGWLMPRVGPRVPGVSAHRHRKVIEPAACARAASNARRST